MIVIAGGRLGRTFRHNIKDTLLRARIQLEDKLQSPPKKKLFKYRGVCKASAKLGQPPEKEEIAKSRGRKSKCQPGQPPEEETFQIPRG